MNDKQVAMERTVHVGEREIELVCPICGGKKFFERTTLMNTAGMTFLGWDWANSEAINFVCEDCTYIFWFMKDPTIAIPKDRPMSRAEQYEIDFRTYSNDALYNILNGKDYNDDAKAAAKSLLRRRKMPV